VFHVAEGGGEKQATGDAGTADVFISYATPDKSAADSICTALERGGIVCWIAPRDVTPGVFYADAIVQAINSARILIVVLSVNSAGSQHVLREVERASAKRRPLVAFRLDTTPLPTGLEYFLSASHWLDASRGAIERALPGLVDAVHRLLGPPGKPVIDTSIRDDSTVNASGGVAATKGATPKQRRNRLWIAAAVVAVVLLALLAGKYWSRARTEMDAGVTARNAVVAPAAAPAMLEKSIAVLPFTDMSEKKDQEYFGDGMAEEILDLLAKIPGLTVIGRTSSFQFKGKNADLRTIGTELSAAHVLEGSVRNSGDQVRVTAQLINTRTGTHEWSETYDRHIGDVLKLQDAIAAAVARELQLTVAPEYLPSRATLKNADVYDLILRGRHAADRWDQEGLDEAVTLFQQALDRDVTSADAAAALALTYETQGEQGFLAPAAAFEQARRTAAIALRLDPKNALAHLVLGIISVAYDWDWAAAEREFQQVATLAPGSADALIGAAVLSRTLGRWDEALRQVKAALAQDPLDPDSFEVLMKIQWGRGHLPEAEAAVRRTLEIRQTFGWAHFFLGVTLLARGDRDAALLEMQRETSDDAQQEGLAMAYHALGRKADSDAVLARMLKDQADRNAFGVAEVYAFGGQADEAMHWLERAYTQKDVGLYYIKADLPLKSLAADPRFKAFLRKMNLPD
jgi:TolB-like protein/Tfp pilus assembly protein PilF